MRKTFVKEVGGKFTVVLGYYRDCVRTLGGVGQVSELEGKRECIELYEMLRMALREGSFEWKGGAVGGILPFIDVVVYCYTKAVLENIPES